MERPDGEWSILLVNKDSANGHKVKIQFADYGANRLRSSLQEKFRSPRLARSNTSGIRTGAKSHADPDGPPLVSSVEAKPNAELALPRASITVIRGKLR